MVAVTKKPVKKALKKAPESVKPPTPMERLNKIGIDAICEYVANGDSLRSWTKLNGFVQQTVINWIEADEVRTGHYARARDERP